MQPLILVQHVWNTVMFCQAVGTLPVWALGLGLDGLWGEVSSVDGVGARSQHPALQG